MLAGSAGSSGRHAIPSARTRSSSSRWRRTSRAKASERPFQRASSSGAGTVYTIDINSCLNPRSLCRPHFRISGFFSQDAGGNAHGPAEDGGGNG